MWRPVTRNYLCDSQLNLALEARRSDVRFVKRDSKALDPAGSRAKIAPLDRIGHPVEDDSRQELRRRIPPSERRVVVQVSIAQATQDRMERCGRTADVHDDAVGIEIGLAELYVNDVRGPVELLCRAKHRSAK